jgi:fimbrial chaperone protein
MNPGSITKRLLSATFAASFMFAAPLRAQGLEISPILIEMAQGQMTSTLTVGNGGSRDVAVQLRPFTWTQNGDADRLEPTDILALSPPITSIPAGKTQLFRLVLRRPAASSEVAYRLLLDEVPPADRVGTVQIALRLSIPIFAMPTGAVAPHVSWKVVASPGGPSLVAVNTGNRRIRVNNFQLRGAAVSVVPGANSYVLAGSTRNWRLSGNAALPPGTTLRLIATSDLGPIDVPVPIVAQ